MKALLRYKTDPFSRKMYGILVWDPYYEQWLDIYEDLEEELQKVYDIKRGDWLLFEAVEGGKGPIKGDKVTICRPWELLLWDYHPPEQKSYRVSKMWSDDSPSSTEPEGEWGEYIE